MPGGAMKVALLSYEYPTETGFGGIGTYTWYQARALARLGHDVRVIAGSVQPGVFHSEHDGVQVTRVLHHGAMHGAIVGLRNEHLGWAPIRLRNAVGAYHAMRGLLEHESYDIVEYPECGADGMMISTLLPVRRCVRFHSPAPLIMEMYGADDRDQEVATFFEQVAVDRADVRIAPSRFLTDQVVDRLRVPPPVHVIGNGIDLDLFDLDDGIDVVSRFGLPARSSGAVTILFTSRLERRKGAHLLPDICSAILGAYPHVHVVVAGQDVDGVLVNTIQPALAAQGVADRFHYLGRLPLGEVRALVKHVDIHMLPSLWENAPYSCIEAMASGRAVVASDQGGLPELIEDGATGVLAEPDDAASFVSALQGLVEDRALRERLGAAARRAVEERYTAVEVARQTVAVWEGAATAAASPAVRTMGR